MCALLSLFRKVTKVTQGLKAVNHQAVYSLVLPLTLRGCESNYKIQFGPDHPDQSDQQDQNQVYVSVYVIPASPLVASTVFKTSICQKNYFPNSTRALSRNPPADMRFHFIFKTLSPGTYMLRTPDINISQEREAHIYQMEVININKGKEKERYIYQMKKASALRECAFSEFPPNFS